MKIHRFTQKELQEEDRRIYKNNLKKELLQQQIREQKYGNKEKIKVIEYVKNNINFALKQIGVMQ